MTNASTNYAGDPLTLMRSNLKAATAGALMIAAGTPFQITVRDARSLYRWAVDGGPRAEADPRAILYHHTAHGVAAKRSSRYELNLLADIAQSGEWGVPYNFVVMPAPPFRIWYLNDVDRRWPHTLGYNSGTAIAAYGNYSVDQPDVRMVDRMIALADALATMWGEWVPEFQHRDVMATECPGTHLGPMLPGHGRQRGI